MSGFGELEKISIEAQTRIASGRILTYLCQILYLDKDVYNTSLDVEKGIVTVFCFGNYIEEEGGCHERYDFEVSLDEIHVRSWDIISKRSSL